MINDFDAARRTSKAIADAGFHHGNPETERVIENLARCFLALDERVNKMEAALQKSLPLLEGFDDADVVDDGEQPIVAPVIAAVKAALREPKP